MSHYLDPDHDEARPGPIFSIPEALEPDSEIMHAAALVIGRFGLLLRGPTGSGKSLLQRHLRHEAEKRGWFTALISDDYVRVARANGVSGEPGPLLAFAPVATMGLQEVRGFGVTEVDKVHQQPVAVIHLLVDLIKGDEVPRMPSSKHVQTELRGGRVDHLATAERRAVAASDMIFARLSTYISCKSDAR